MSDFSDVTLKLSENTAEMSEEIYKQGNRPQNWDHYTPIQKRAYSYFDGLLGLFERVWIANEDPVGTHQHLRPWRRLLKSKALKRREDRLRTWRAWLKELASVDLFVDVYYENKDQFDPSLMRETESIISASMRKLSSAAST